jgi:hypothetical protein
MGKNAIIKLPAAAAALFFLFAPGHAYSQNTEASKEEATVIQEALKNYESQKQTQQDELIAQLNFRLGQATENWLSSMEKTRDGQLGTFIEQEWDKQARLYTITPVRYDYYLRGYNYSISDSDVIKTDSVTSPYKGVVIITEELYAEKYHHPNISDSKLYYYTVTNTYALNFAYKNDEFVLVGSKEKMNSIVNEISNEAKKYWFK